MLTIRSRSFKRSTVNLYKLKGCKVTSCQSRRCEKSLYLKSWKPSELKLCILRRLRSFQRGTVGLCRLTGVKNYTLSKLEIWKKFCQPAHLEPHACARVRFPDDRIILWLWQLTVAEKKDTNPYNISPMYMRSLWQGITCIKNPASPLNWNSVC